MQLFAASILFMDWSVFAVYQLCLRIESLGLDASSGFEPFYAVRHMIASVAKVAFPIAYLWYAFTQKASNQAMELTAGRCHYPAFT